MGPAPLLKALLSRGDRVTPLLLRGFDRTLRPILFAIRTMADRLVELVFGVDTRGEVSLERFGLQSPGRIDYKAASWTTLARAVRRSEVQPDDVFIDLGAGKGRIVFLAARYRFKRVIGVELSPELSSLARSNLERHRHRLRCRDVEIVNADVLEYQIPDDVTVVFLYNPFQGDVFTTVLSRLLTSVERRPRRLRIIYRNPTEHEALMATGRLRLTRSVRGWRPTPDWSRSNATFVYELLPS